MDIDKVVTAEAVARGAMKFEGLAVDGEDVYWVESRPTEKGRCVLVRQQPGGAPEDVLPQHFSVKSRTHEYGGGAFAVQRGIVVFSNREDDRLYLARPGEAPWPLTPKQSGRFGDLSFDPHQPRVFAVRECEQDEIVAVPLDGKKVHTLVSGDDFYAAPRMNPDGRTLAWLSWNHPDMPWNKTKLWIGTIRSRGVLHPIGTAPTEGSHVDPMWAPDGALWFTVDPHGWWRLYRLQDGSKLQQLVDDKAEYAAPLWGLGQPRFGLLSAHQALSVRRVKGQDQIGIVELHSGRFRRLLLALTEISSIAVNHNTGTVALIAGSPASPLTVYRLQLDKKPKCIQVRPDDHETVQLSDISMPEPISFLSADGATAHAFYYAPAGVRPLARPSTPPPLIVTTHGGPTSATSTVLNLAIQYWTSRGFAILDVNYGGSSGYGRAYRERLHGKWGIVDVADCVAGVRAMVERGYADPERVVIRGGSAGGYTTLACLAFTSGVFRAGACYYGIGNLETLTGPGTDRFESRYLDGLVQPDARNDRSPLFHADRMSCPVIFFHGAQDHVVPSEQSENMVAMLRGKGIRADYHAYPDEGHGFRNGKNIADALEREYAFYGEVLGF